MKLPIYLFLFFLFYSCQSSNLKQEKAVEELRINQIQVLGSHNSYKEAIEPALMQMLLQEDPTRFLELDYAHVALSEQLDLGLRKLEIDILHDPEGGRFSKPIGLTLLEQAGITPQPFDPLDALKAPGFKVMHQQDIDFRSNCLRLVDCLQELKDWSDAHPSHLPLVISFNAKTGSIDRPGFVAALPFTTAAFDALDKEILTILPRERIITPDDVRGDYKTLRAAVLAKNWPLVSESKGKFLFVLNERSKEKQEAYKAGHPMLRNRLLFLQAEPDEPEAAFLFMNNPIGIEAEIQKMVALGYLVRTRADSGTKEARAGDYSRFEAALRSGAQFISTDYYLAAAKLGTGYRIELPGKVVARCNPVNVKQNVSCAFE